MRPYTHEGQPVGALMGTTRAAHYLGRSPSTIRRYSVRGTLQASHWGRCLIFRVHDLDVFRKSRLRLVP